MVMVNIYESTYVSNVFSFTLVKYIATEDSSGQEAGWGPLTRSAEHQEDECDYTAASDCTEKLECDLNVFIKL